MNQTKTESRHELARANKTKTSTFRQWFGDSHVLDAQGDPRPVYHGTDAVIDVFDLQRCGKNYPEAEHAFFFTDRKQSANNYAILHAGNAGTPNVVTAYLSIQNPAIFTAYDYHAAVDRYDLNISPIVFNLQAEGHDGVIVHSPNGSLFVAFNALQILIFQQQQSRI